MSKSQRNKGAGGERELSRLLSDALGFVVKRKLGAAREGGDDMEVGNFSVEVKRRKGIGCIRFLEQADTNAEIDKIPVVMMREDGGQWVVLLSLDDFLPMMRDYL